MQRMKIVFDVAKSKGYFIGDNPVEALKRGQALPKVQAIPEFCAQLAKRKSVSSKALAFLILAAGRKMGRV